MISGNYTAVQNNKTIQKKQQPGFSGIGVHPSIKGTEIGKALGEALKLRGEGYEAIEAAQKLTDGGGWDVLIGQTIKGDYFLEGKKAGSTKRVPFQQANLEDLDDRFKKQKNNGQTPLGFVIDFLQRGTNEIAGHFWI